MHKCDVILAVFSALFGAFIGFIVSELKAHRTQRRIKNRYRNKFNPLVGRYTSITKSGEKGQLFDVKITGFENNILFVKLNTKKNGPAIGKLIMKETNLDKGTLYYHHVQEDKKHLSGYYDITIVDKGIIHAHLSYLKGKTRKGVEELYIWTKNKNYSKRSVYNPNTFVSLLLC